MRTPASRIVLADKAGFCAGVARAVDIASQAGEESLRSGKGSAATLGPLVHNPDVAARLLECGVEEISSIEAAQGRVLIVPSHGLSPDVVNHAQELGLTIVDATCPHVTRLQREVAKANAEGKFVVMLGDSRHPEVRAVASCAHGCIAIVATPKDVDFIQVPPGPVILVAQTTQKKSDLGQTAARLAARGIDVKTIDTICPATRERQEAAARLAEVVDFMVVIGGKSSANTMRLAEVSRDNGADTIQVENARELTKVDPKRLRNAKLLGVTAGASTPSWVIEEVMDAMSEIIEGNPEQVQGLEESAAKEENAVGTEEARDAVAAAESDAAAGIDTQVEEGQPKPETHQAAAAAESKPNDELIKAKVIALDDNSVTVELGPGESGIIQKDQLSVKPVSHPSEVVSVGDEIYVVPDRPHAGSDTQYVSKRRADILLTWQTLEHAEETGEIIEGKVTEAVKGGLVVDVGVRGFVPASQVGRRFVEDLSVYVGQTLRLKVKELERLRSNVVLSHRAVLEEEEKIARERAFEALEAGQVLTGTVTRLATFGAFVDIGEGVEGLLHISDISWSRIKHPSEILSEGQQIQVQVLAVDSERQRISLGYKQLQPDPWERVSEKYPVGSVVRGTVTKLVDFGAFVSLEDGIEGLVHISQLADRRVAKADEIVSVGQEVTVKVIGVRIDDHRISLSIKQAQEDGERNEYRKYMRDTKADDVVTIGDRINFDPSKLIRESSDEDK